jgi:sortase A
VTQLDTRPDAIGGGGASAPPPPARPKTLVSQLTSSVTVLLAILLLAFVLEVTALGAVRHARNQDVAYKELRTDFANSVGPTGQLDQDGTPLPLGKPIALLNIPSIGLREVVLEGTTARVLQSGPGHRRDSVFPGQPGTSVIFGRQAGYGGPFRKITDLKPGATIEVVTGESAATIKYSVTKIRYAGDKGVVSTDPKVGRLTLVTGHGPLFMPTDAVRVDATLVTEPLAAPGFAFGASALDGSENAMAGDDSGALQLFLWAQLLLVLSVLLAWVRSVWGQWQSWLVTVPVLGFVGFKVAGLVAQLLPNLM